jgi:hypothetical protein
MLAIRRHYRNVERAPEFADAEALEIRRATALRGGPPVRLHVGERERVGRDEVAIPGLEAAVMTRATRSRAQRSR